MDAVVYCVDLLLGLVVDLLRGLGCLPLDFSKQNADQVLQPRNLKELHGLQARDLLVQLLNIQTV